MANNDIVKIYDPAPQVSYIIYTKNKRKLYSASGNISSIKRYCDKAGIDYSKCKDVTVSGCHYLEREK